MGLSNVYNSGRRPAFNGNIDTVFEPITFWTEMYNGDTGYEFYGSYYNQKRGGFYNHLFLFIFV